MDLKTHEELSGYAANMNKFGPEDSALIKAQVADEATTIHVIDILSTPLRVKRPWRLRIIPKPFYNVFKWLSYWRFLKRMKNDKVLFNYQVPKLNIWTGVISVTVMPIYPANHINITGIYAA